jgi:hypothetical protein
MAGTGSGSGGRADRHQGPTDEPEILPCVIDGTVVLAGRCPELLDGLAEHPARITADIDARSAARDTLDSVIGRPLIAEPLRR